MKSQRRHELQHNTLDAELASTITFFRKHWKKMLMGTAIIITIVLAIVTYVRKESAKTAAIVSTYAQINAEINRNGGTGTDAMLEKLVPLSTQTRVPSVAASAHVNMGDIHAAAAVNGAKDRSAQAAAQYNLVIDNFSEQKLPVAKAHMGLAEMAESADNLDEARKHYEAIKTLANELKSPVRNLPIVAFAEVNARDLEKPKRKVRMATTRPASVTTQPSVPDEAAAAQPSVPDEAAAAPATP